MKKNKKHLAQMFPDLDLPALIDFSSSSEPSSSSLSKKFSSFFFSLNKKISMNFKTFRNLHIVIFFLLNDD